MHERSLRGERVGINEHCLDILLNQIFPNKSCFFIPQRNTYLACAETGDTAGSHRSQLNSGLRTTRQRNWKPLVYGCRGFIDFSTDLS